jgi:hypothetical protein
MARPHSCALGDAVQLTGAQLLLADGNTVAASGRCLPHRGVWSGVADRKPHVADMLAAKLKAYVW